jgi:hypothetical protein
MRTATLVALLGAAVLHSQPAPAPTPTPPIKNFVEGWIAVVSCEKRIEFGGGWTLTVKNISNTALAHITVSGYEGGSQSQDFLGPTVPGAPTVSGLTPPSPVTPPSPAIVVGAVHVGPPEGLVPGATFTFQVGGTVGRPERILILEAVAVDGRFVGAWVNFAQTLAAWLGESVQKQRLYELTKVLATNDSNDVIDAVIERIQALDPEPPLSIDSRIQRLVSDPSLRRDSGMVQGTFHSALRVEKERAVQNLTSLKTTPTAYRHAAFEFLQQMDSARSEALQSVLSQLR